ncbi:alpha/beta fold hydrolase [Streptomyces sp. NPDC001792]|uniref:alpha/beta fold hydrolase n=1 Tax=Streptomyces sp. NPDC001792 TaxID=3154524 RepID=UPI0033202BBA
MLAYEVHGSGPGQVLLPGVGGTAALTWETLLAGLAAEHTVVLTDLPGSGRSPLPVGRLALDTVADQVVTAAERAGFSQFVIAGPSLGAAVATNPVAGLGEYAVQLWMKRLGTTSATAGYGVRSAAGTTTYARGSRTVIRLDSATMRPTPWSERGWEIARTLGLPEGEHDRAR